MEVHLATQPRLHLGREVVHRVATTDRIRYQSDLTVRGVVDFLKRDRFYFRAAYWSVMKRLNTMIRMVLGDCPGAIKLFCEDNSHHAVWQSQTRDPDQAIGIGFESSIEPIGTADDKHDITTILLPVAEVLGQRNASPVFASFI